MKNVMEIFQSSSTTYQHGVEADTFPTLQVAKAVVKEQLENQEFKLLKEMDRRGKA